MNSSIANSWTLCEARGSADGPPCTAGLDSWPAQVPAVIQGFVACTDPEGLRTQRRLAELGFLPGEPVRIVARGWLRGSPVAARVGQSTFALRAHEAAMLRVHEVRPAA